MANSVLNEVVAIRSLLNYPLPQSPSFEDILEMMESEYQAATNQTNNSPNAWQKGTLTFTTTIGVREYQIITDDDDFDKPLVILTVPTDANQFPERQLEFVEVEYMSQEWNWLSSSRGSLWQTDGHDAVFAGFYHKLSDEGDEVWCELRPTPATQQTYKVIYQVTDWWSKVFATQDLGYGLPYAAHKHYFRALIAFGILYKCRWSMDRNADKETKSEIAITLQNQIARYKPAFDQWIDSLTVPDVVQGESYADQFLALW